ncbi:NAD-dependent epimerase/dehydratase family protein [Paracoccus saliphilus]|uniref:Dihydroflavonol-4-reductase n=2 Tax=Paracoccus saliphilus TaxID=405559 RepID=A0AA46A5C2_9RHOB|nr:NAD-dependent epimerase/dehydratase family protein [Paracoccus saliphilus]SIS79265.1 dihydroflavonol-4-reductase [Paracoccus saliphilus]
MNYQDLDMDRNVPVMLTGATGYLASWILHDLLELGLTVHATVRDPDSAKAAALRDMATGKPGELRLFAADLADAESFDAPMQGCAVVIHTASPYRLTVDDPESDLIRPAIEGTRHVLAAANRNADIRKIVLTSSCAAIFGDVADCAQAPGGILTEEIWNNSSGITHNPYAYSKTLAEKAAWDMHDAQDRWSLAVINPAVILGPAVGTPPKAESFDIIRGFGNGTLRTGVPQFEVGMVDVRDVAMAHILAGFGPATGRHILSEKTLSFLDIAETLRPRFGKDFPLPRRELPKWLLWLVGPLVDKRFTRRFVARNLGHRWQADNRKSREGLGLTYRGVEPGIVEMFAQMVKAGQFGKAGN